MIIAITDFSIDYYENEVWFLVAPDSFDINKERELHQKHLDEVVNPYLRTLPDFGLDRRIPNKALHKEYTKYRHFEDWLKSRYDKASEEDVIVIHSNTI